MAVITSIRPQKFKKEWFNLFLDDKFAFSLPAETLVKAGLAENQIISSEKVAALIEENDFFTTYDKVLNFLSFRPRSKFEISQYLSKKEVGEKTKDKIMDKIKKLGFLDDEKFARWLVEQRSGTRPKGKYFLEEELRQKGVDKPLIKELMGELRPKESDFELAQKLALNKLENWKNLPSKEVKNKLFGFLFRRGFSYEVVGEVIDKLCKRE